MKLKRLGEQIAEGYIIPSITFSQGQKPPDSGIVSVVDGR